VQDAAIVLEALKWKRSASLRRMHHASAVGERLDVLDGVEELAGWIGGGLVSAAASHLLDSVIT
jgi:hypothetical protein